MLHVHRLMHSSRVVSHLALETRNGNTNTWGMGDCAATLGITTVKQAHLCWHYTLSTHDRSRISASVSPQGNVHSTIVWQSNKRLYLKMHAGSCARQPASQRNYSKRRTRNQTTPILSVSSLCLASSASHEPRAWSGGLPFGPVCERPVCELVRLSRGRESWASIPPESV